MDNDERDHHGGLARDLRKLAGAMSRRQVFGLIGGASLLPLFGCGDDGGTGGDAGGGGGGGGGAECSTIPQETAGPYPGDGTNGPNALTLSGIVRSDIRSSIEGASGVAEGVPLTIRLTLTNSNGRCAPLAGYTVYLWHCDRNGEYSMYTGAAASENYLRGVQETDADGEVTFVSIFPACYSGRWPHIHFEIYESLDAAMSGANELHTSQLALPEAVCDEVYASSGYEQSVANLNQTSLTSDNVFRDGASQQIATVTGNVTDGYVATLAVGVPA